MKYNQTHLYFTEVTFDLLDAGGVVHHPNYLILCERARVKAMEQAGAPFGDLLQEGIAIAILEIYLNYHQALRLGQKIVILTSLVESAKNSILTIKQQICSFGEELAPWTDSFRMGPVEIPKKQVFFQAQLKAACISLNPMKIIRMPPLLSSALDLSEPER